MTKPISAERSSDEASKANSNDAKCPKINAPEERLTCQELLWKKENKPGIEAYNDYITKHGLFNDRMRKL
jgi:post-segregation antitoxin (ccd killing protein)